MPDFEIFLARHGEPGAQALIEALERREGVRSHAGISLKDRWNSLMQPANDFSSDLSNLSKAA